MTGFIAVHCGAGYHKTSLRAKYKKLCKEACTAAARILNAGGSAFLACETAVMILEGSPLTNAGFGSSLSMSGEVECDASIMDGESLNFGACGSVKSVRYPISLASQICLDQTSRPAQLMPPMLLVGPGATEYARKSNLAMIDNKKMVTKRAKRSYEKYKYKLKLYDLLQVESTDSKSQQSVNNIGEDHAKDPPPNQVEPKQFVDLERMDTVGAVCVDSKGHVASACSSGGISMKHNGRIGQAATYGCGVWADSLENLNKRSVAVSTTGAGEYIIKTMLAKQLATKIQTSQSPALAFHKCMKEDFLESKLLMNAKYKIGGALIIYVDPSGEGEIFWGHSSRTMGVAYMNATQNINESTFSELPPSKEGNSVTLSAFQFRLNDE